MAARGASVSPFQVMLFTRRHCGICEHAKDSIHALQPRFGFEFKEVDIDKPEHKTWLRQYNFDVPVVHIGGVEALRHRIEQSDVEGALVRFLQTRQSANSSHSS